MIELSNVCGLPIFLDEETGEISYGEEVICKEAEEVNLSELLPILLNKYLRYPEQIYKHFKSVVKDGDEQCKGADLSYDIIKLPYGLLGVEYIKTHIYFADPGKGKYSCVIEIISGELTVLMQKNSSEQDEYSLTTNVEEVLIVTMEAGDKMAIPRGYYYTFVNAGSTAAVFAIVNAKENKKIDYTELSKEKGLAMYIISKNAKIEIVANPKYKLLEAPILGFWKELNESVKVRFSVPEVKNNEDQPLYDYYKSQLDELEEVLAY